MDTCFTWKEIKIIMTWICIFIALRERERLRRLEGCKSSGITILGHQKCILLLPWNVRHWRV